MKAGRAWVQAYRSGQLQKLQGDLAQLAAVGQLGQNQQFRHPSLLSTEYMITCQGSINAN